jgi:hypothetical protein
MNNEVHKMIIFQRKNEDTKMLEGACKIIKEQQGQSNPKRRLTKEDIIREIISNRSSEKDKGEMTEKEKFEHVRLQEALNTQQDQIARKNSALNKYKFDLILEEEEGDDDSLGDKFNSMLI